MILRNLSWLTVSQAVRLFTGLFVGAWLTRSLGPEKNGLLGTAMVISSLMGFAAELGLRQILIKELSVRVGDAGLVFGTAVRLMFSWGLVCFAIACGVAWWWGGAEMLIVASILCASLPLNAYLAVLSRWDAAQQAQRTARLGILANTLAALARIVCILSGADLRWAAFTLLLEVVISAVVAFGWSFKNGWAADLRLWDGKVARSLLRESLPLFLAHSGTLLLLRVDQLMIYHLRGAAEAGVYAAATRLSEIVYAVGPLMIMTFMPVLARSFQKDPFKYQRQCAWLFGGLSLLAYGSILFWWALGPWVVQVLYGDAFEQASMILFVHGIAALPYLHGELRSALLVIERKTLWSVRCAAAGLLINVLLNLWLIPRHGAVGAAWATAIAYTLVWLVASWVVPALRSIGSQQLAGLVSPFWLWRQLRQWRLLMS
ncbi:O-antigen/teichoic acid export membrane protein [Prosthecobacter fusiformis]|uniref:O-antigen/teichoic acid export membrane protein n=1 Tax=Prosthecobacter fusiformis TaxID=48464 RepID=A0A4R7S739_9BACT|nr:flippase [Prosthecobacter fusiformis]TDU73398.1 O-antigen/teichoic acid export membrane protein [Prosthecobacter fusiformis]